MQIEIIQRYSQVKIFDISGDTFDKEKTINSFLLSHPNAILVFVNDKIMVYEYIIEH